MGVISFNNVSKVLSNKIKIKDINLEIEESKSISIHCSYEISVAILKLIYGNIQPTSGTVLVDDINKIAKVFAKNGYDKNLTVSEVIKFYARVFRGKVNYTEIFDRFSLQDIENEKISNLLKYQRVFLGLAVAYVQNPKVIVIHEPTINWRDSKIELVKEIISFLKKEGIGTLILTVLKEDAIYLADKSYHINNDGTLSVYDTAVTKNESDNKLKIVKIPVKVDNKILLFNPFEIDYIEAFNNNTCIYVNGNSYHCTFNISELEKKLEHFGFFRNHRSYLVNLQKVKEVVMWSKSSNLLVLNDKKNSNVPISKARLDSLKQIIQI